MAGTIFDLFLCQRVPPKPPEGVWEFRACSIRRPQTTRGVSFWPASLGMRLMRGTRARVGVRAREARMREYQV
jgi:hypothetical protein